jgi:hypothetical protein
MRAKMKTGRAGTSPAARAVLALCVAVAACAATAVAQEGQPAAATEHDAEILGVRIGMDVPSALEAVFLNAKRKPGEERPDAKRAEGRDVRVVYKKLPQGELQIVFAEGKWVKEVVLTYAAKPSYEELRLAPTGSIGGAGTSDTADGRLVMGKKYDDRYQIGYTSDRKLERFWWRDEPAAAGDYRVRVGFVSERLAGGGQLGGKTVGRKIVGVAAGDEEKFARAMAAR